jgi:hypothetical protein
MLNYKSRREAEDAVTCSMIFRIVTAPCLSMSCGQRSEVQTRETDNTLPLLPPGMDRFRQLTSDSSLGSITSQA